jgi:hypothetical protein
MEERWLNMAGLADLMQYKPDTSSSILGSLHQGVQDQSNLAQADYQRAMATYQGAQTDRYSQMTPYEVNKAGFEQQQREVSRNTPGYFEAHAGGAMGSQMSTEAAGRQAMELWKQQPEEYRRKIQEEQKKQTEDFFNRAALNILSYGQEQGIDMMRRNAGDASIIAQLTEDGLLGNLTEANARKRMDANPDLYKAMETQGLQNQGSLDVAQINAASRGSSEIRPTDKERYVQALIAEGMTPADAWKAANTQNIRNTVETHAIKYDANGNPILVKEKGPGDQGGGGGSGDNPEVKQAIYNQLPREMKLLATQLGWTAFKAQHPAAYKDALTQAQQRASIALPQGATLR